MGRAFGGGMFFFTRGEVMSDTKTPGKTVWVVMGHCGEYDDYNTWVLCVGASEESAARIVKEATAESAALQEMRRSQGGAYATGKEWQKLYEARVVDRTSAGKEQLGDYYFYEVEVRS